MEKFDSLLISVLVILPLVLLVILMAQKRRGVTVIVSCVLIGLVVATILEISFQQHPHIPVPIWAMLQVVIAFVIPVLAIAIRFMIKNTGIIGR
ncbi:hypothetical protein [Kangiella koreensis]|uniref:Uncharacterized protein n=1 Tax=Kangiella koreensis (strain DSM 16069 / JCM 12317 / KCTC 12182 / SW-125) TaxID=523791 RepID=C7R6K9_KANKD|nr:hypothetical protein [Kangiella koreensis]ACV25525.1 hypothetical protein Kkor_0104 [Kangiella koreensis DSM 16069]